MEYNFREIEKKWQEYWIANGVYKVKENILSWLHFIELSICFEVCRRVVRRP